MAQGQTQQSLLEALEPSKCHQSRSMQSQLTQLELVQSFKETRWRKKNPGTRTVKPVETEFAIGEVRRPIWWLSSTSKPNGGLNWMKWQLANISYSCVHRTGLNQPRRVSGIFLVDWSIQSEVRRHSQACQTPWKYVKWWWWRLGTPAMSVMARDARDAKHT